MHTIKAALFDLDGVIIDTESQYSLFWGSIGRQYRPDVPDFAERIKGTTLESIYTHWFAHLRDEQPEITQRLTEFEQQMQYTYIEAVCSFIKSLREAGIKTAIVTASNEAKMRSVLRVHPEFPTLFDRILTSKDYAAGKPAPDCYIEGAKAFGARPEECVVFEDSINGLRAGRDSGAFVVALTTTNPYEAVAPLAHMVVADFERLTLDDIQKSAQQQWLTPTTYGL